MQIDRLQPAEKGEIALYMPYYSDKKRKYLGTAIGLYKQKNLEGSRRIEGGEDIPFVASWNVSSLPADLTRCRIQFDDNAELTYEVMMANYEFIDSLIDVIVNYHRNRANSIIDFSKGFYRKLLHYD